MQCRLERCILRCSIEQRITEFCMFWVERQTLPIYLPLLCLGSSLSSFYKVDENPNSCNKVEWEDYNLSRQHLDNGRVQERVTDTKRYSIFLLQNLGFFINFKKSVLHQCHILEFLGLEIDSLNMRVELSKEKVEKTKKQCQSLLLLEKFSVRDLLKLMGRNSYTTMAAVPAPLQYRGLNNNKLHVSPWGGHTKTQLCYTKRQM